ncbi:MAG TPA: YbjN domain-containing protein [Alphaproteobacteria bacterium]|nr:YbjN domain-containing protein [Alphaproteobacteria bacterium]HRI75610.1 YbjN domain-containing protein [Alphaproteobacteria bacterium]HRJ67056.1 YbjN domain-containing protein [Alphaproteobacteria bacterium]
MIGSPFELAHDDNNPLDMVEELARSKGWNFTRTDEDFFVMTVPGQHGPLEIWLEWQDEFSALLLSCSMPVEIAEEQYEMACRTLEQINENIWLGHFDLSNKGTYPTFRHTLLLRMIPSGIAIDTIHDVVDIAMSECNRFYTTFQLVQSGDVRLQDNLSAAVFDTVGEA